MVNLSDAESAFAKKLASNKKQDRNKALKRLKNWLRGKSSSGKRLNENDGLKLWKGLFYCMWMSDKPLVQEKLGNAIGSLVITLEAEVDVFVFVGCFFTTMCREWFGIDKWRIDKFGMFTRRFLRHCLMYLKSHDWNESLVKGVMSAVGKHGTTETDLHTPVLGFQMLLANIYMEEVAVVGTEELPSRVLSLLLEPWILAMSVSTDSRYLHHIQDRIFKHLMQQTDLGIEYQANLRGFTTRPPPDEERDDDSDEEEERSSSSATAMDPRAGGEDVVLPQLSVDFAAISKQLIEVLNNPSLIKRQRKIISGLAQQFRTLSEGRYPFTAKVREKHVRGINEDMIIDATEELIAASKGLEGKKSSKTSKRLKRMKLQDLEAERSEDEDLSSDLSSDDEVERENKFHPDPTTHVLQREKQDEIEPYNVVETSTDKTEKKKRGRKRKKLRKSKLVLNGETVGAVSHKNFQSSTPVGAQNQQSPGAQVVVERTDNSPTKQPEIKKAKIRIEKCDSPKKSNSPKPQMPIVKSPGSHEVKEAKVVIKRCDGTVKETPSLQNGENTSKVARVLQLNETSTEPSSWLREKLTRSIKLKSRESKTPHFLRTSMTTFSTPQNYKKKCNIAVAPGSAPETRKIKFALHHNIAHAAVDYHRDILRSPAIPYSATQQPTHSVLKSSPHPIIIARKRSSQRLVPQSPV